MVWKPPQYTNCAECGAKYAELVWPRTCQACGAQAFRNPLPVSVALVRVGTGILGVRRGIDPKKGELALPGGFHNFGELWQTALVREVDEECGIVLPESEVKLFTLLTSDDGKHNLAFGTVETHLGALPPFTPNEETEELVILRGDETLAFPLHTQALHMYAAHLAETQARARIGYDV